MLLETIAGKNRASVAASILQNADVLRSVYETSSTQYKGSAQQELDKYLDSITAKLQKFTNEVHEFWNGLISSDAVKFFVEIGTQLLNIVNTMGQWKTAAAALISIVSVKGLGFFGTTFVDGNKKATIFKKTLGEISDIFKGFRSDGDNGLKAVLKTFGEINPLGGFFKNFKKTLGEISDIFKGFRNNGDSGLKAVLKTFGEINPLSGFFKDFKFDKLKELQSIREQIEDYMKVNQGVDFDTAWNAMGDSVKNVDDRMKSLLATQNGTIRSSAELDKAFLNASTVSSRFTNIVKSLGAGLFNAFATGAIMFGIQKLIEGITYLATASQRAREQTEKAIKTYQEEQKTFKSQSDVINKLGERYAELSKKVDPLGRNVGLTTEEFNEYKSVTSQIAEAFPGLIKGYDDQNNAILKTKGSVEELNQALRDNQIISYTNILKEGSGVMDMYQDAMDIDNMDAKSLLQYDRDIFDELYRVLLDTNSEKELGAAIETFVKNSFSNIDDEALRVDLQRILNHVVDNIGWDEVGDSFEIFDGTAFGFLDDNGEFDNTIKLNFIEAIKRLGKEASSEIQTQVNSVRDNILIPYFRRYLLEHADSAIAQNKDFQSLATAIINNIDESVINSFNGNNNAAERYVFDLVDSINKASTDPKTSEKLTNAMNVLFGNAMTDSSGILLSGFSPKDYLDEINKALDVLRNDLHLDNDFINSLFKELLDGDELKRQSRNYVQAIFDMEDLITGAYSFDIIDKYLKDNGINTINNIAEFYSFLVETTDKGITDWEEVTKRWEDVVASKMHVDEFTPLSSLVAPDSSSKEKIDAFKQDIQKIGEALNNFGTSAFDATDIYETFGATFPEIIDGSELTEDALRRLAIAEWNLVDAEFEGTEGTDNYRKALRALLDQALSTGSGFKSVLKNMAGMPQANEIKRQAEATGSKELMSLYYKLLGNASKEYDKLNKYTRFFTDAQKDSWTTVTSGARNADEAIQKWETHLKDLSFDSFGDVINDEVFQSVRSATEQINEMFENDILDEDEIQTLREQFYFTDDEIAAGAVQDYQTWLNSIVELYAQKGGEAGEAWFKEWFGKQDTKTFSEIINQIAEEAIANASGRGGGRYDKKVLTNFQNQAKTLSNVEKEIFASQYREGDSFEEVLEKVNAQLQRMSGKSLPDLLNDDTFSALVSEAQELSSILQNGVNFEEGNTLLEKWGLTSDDVKNGLADTLLASMRNTIQGVSASAGAAGVEWFQGFKKTLYDSSQPINLDDVLNFEFSFDKNGQMITQTLNEYASEIISKARTIGTTIANITSDATASGHITWAEVFGDPEQLRELESIVPGISSQIQAVINGEMSETQVIANLKTAMANLNTQYLENTGSIRETANLTEEASAALQRQDELVADATNYNVAYKNGLLDVADSLGKIYFDGAYEGARSFGQAVTDLKGELDTLNGAYTQLIDGSLRENSVEFKNLVADLTAQFPQLVGHTDSIHELAGAVAELMNVKGDSFVTLLDQLRNREGIPDELRGKIESLINSFHKLGTQPFSMDNAINVIKNARQELDQLATFMHKVNETGLHLSVDATDDVYNLYPELLKKAEIYKDGTIKINKEVYDDFIDARQAEVQGDIQARIKELENRREVLKAAIAIEQKKIDIADAALKSKNMIVMQEAINEIKAIELKQKADAEANLNMAKGSEALAEKKMDDSTTTTEKVVNDDGIQVEADGEKSEDEIDNSNTVTETKLANSEFVKVKNINDMVEQGEIDVEAKTAEADRETQLAQLKSDLSDEVTKILGKNNIEVLETDGEVTEGIAANDEQLSKDQVENSDTVTETKSDNLIGLDAAHEVLAKDVVGFDAEAAAAQISNADTTAEAQQTDMSNVEDASNGMNRTIVSGSAESSSVVQDNAERTSHTWQTFLGGVISKFAEVAQANVKASQGDTNIANTGFFSGIVRGVSNAFNGVKNVLKTAGSGGKFNLSSLTNGPFSGNTYVPNFDGTNIQINLSGLGDKIKSGISSVTSDLSKFFKEHKISDIVNNVSDNVSKFVGEITTNGKKMITDFKGFINNLKNITPEEAAKALTNAIANIGNKLTELGGGKIKVSKKTADDFAKELLNKIKDGDVKPYTEYFDKPFDELKNELLKLKEGSEQEKAILEAELEEVERIIAYLKANGGLEAQPWHDNKYGSDDGTGTGSNDGAGSGDRDGTGSGDHGGSDKDPKEEAEKEEEQFEEQVDWIEVRIQRIERIINKLDTVANNSFENFQTRNKAIAMEIETVKEEFDDTAKAYERYMEEANAVPLDEAYKEKVRRGLIDIESITDEELKNNIEAYQQWYEKAISMQDKLYELAQKTSQLYKQTFENIRAQADAIVGVMEKSVQMINNAVSRTQTQGYLVSENYYNALIENAEQQLIEKEGERRQLIAQFQKAVDAGAVEMYSQEWYEWRNAIDEVTLSMDQLTTSIVEYKDQIQQIQWDNFDLMQSRISDMANEAQFIIDLMSNEVLYNDKGYITNRGIATKGMHGLLYNTYMEQADLYETEMKRINEELANDPNNTKLYDRRQQLLEQQREMILAAEAEKDSLKSLVSDGIQKTLSALQELITTYEEAIQKQYDMYTFSKNVEQQTKNITNLQKQLASLSGDDSEENRKKLQELNNSLGEAQQSLEETLYERSISDQKEMLDDLYQKFDTILNARLDNLDVLIAENIAQINLSSGQIADTLNVVTGDVGYRIQSGFDEIFSKADEQLMPALATYTSEYMTTLSNEQAKTNDEISGVKTGIIANITANAGVISGYINTMAAAMGHDFTTANGLIGDSIYGIKVNARALELAKETLSDNVTGSGGSIKSAIENAEKIMNGSIGSIGTNMSAFKTDFSSKSTTANEKLGNIVDGVKKMVDDSNHKADQIMFTIKDELEKSNVQVTEGSAKDIGKGVYDQVADLDDIVKYTRATAYNTMTKPAAEDLDVDLSDLTKKADDVKINNNTGNTAGGTKANNDKTKEDTTKSDKPKNNINKDTTTQGNGKPEIDDTVTLKAGEEYYYTANSTTPVGDYFNGQKNAVEIFEIAQSIPGYYEVNRPYRIRKAGTKPGDPYSDLGWVSLDQLEGYKKGTLSVDKDRLALMNEGGHLETIVRPDGTILTPLSKKTMVINAESTNNMWKMLQDPEKFMGAVLENTNNSSQVENINNGGNIENNIEVNIQVAHVDNFDDFMRQLQHSEKFEQLFTSMFDNRSKGTSKFNKFNVRI